MSGRLAVARDDRVTEPRTVGDYSGDVVNVSGTPSEHTIMSPRQRAATEAHRVNGKFARRPPAWQQERDRRAAMSPAERHQDKRDRMHLAVGQVPRDPTHVVSGPNICFGCGNTRTVRHLLGGCWVGYLDGGPANG